MADALELARKDLLSAADIDESALSEALGRLMTARVDAADLYFQLTRHETWGLEDGIVRDASFNIEQGVGVRAIAGEKTGFAYSDEIRMPALLEAAGAARAIARAGGNQQVQAWHASAGRSLYLPDDPIAAMESVDKVALLQRLDAAARALDPRVKQVMVSLSGVHDTVLIAASDGTLAGDVRPLVRLNVSVVVEENGRRETGYGGGGGRFG